MTKTNKNLWTTILTKKQMQEAHLSLSAKAGKVSGIAEHGDISLAIPMAELTELSNLQTCYQLPSHFEIGGKEQLLRINPQTHSALFKADDGNLSLVKMQEIANKPALGHFEWATVDTRNLIGFFKTMKAGVVKSMLPIGRQMLLRISSKGFELRQVNLQQASIYQQLLKLPAEVKSHNLLLSQATVSVIAKWLAADGNSEIKAGYQADRLILKAENSFLNVPVTPTTPSELSLFLTWKYLNDSSKLLISNTKEKALIQKMR